MSGIRPGDIEEVLERSFVTGSLPAVAPGLDLGWGGEDRKVAPGTTSLNFPA